MSLYDELKEKSTSSANFSDLFSRRAMATRTLTDCICELTPVCNFRCPFCYARMTPQEIAAGGVTPLTLAEWKDCIDQLVALKLLQITFTGGECTLWPHFAELYEYAYQKGLIISLLTNGSGINDELLTLFHRCPPNRIYITLYGANADTYQTICGNSSFYDVVHRNIEALVAAGQQVIAQFTAGEGNTADLERVYHYTESLGIPLRFNRELIQFGRCTQEVLEQTKADDEQYLSAAKAVWLAQHGYDAQQFDALPPREYTLVDNPDAPGKGVPCNAGRSSCFIRWDGTLRPCVSWDAFCMNIRTNTIAEAWQALVRWADEVPRLSECKSCIHQPHCKQCLAIHYNDTKQYGKPSERLCWKCTHPERARETEETYRKTGHLYTKDMLS